MSNNIIDLKTAKRIKHKLLKKIDNIGTGYVITSWEQDGCDEYGHLYWVTCKNGFGARSYNIESHYNKSIKQFKKDIVDNGIVYNDKKYWVDYNFFYYFSKKYRIKFISQDRHQSEEQTSNRNKIDDPFL